MVSITLRVLDGADRGRVFERLSPPVTIGREEGNAVQLNDDRVSRCHVKIQEQDSRLVLTDLESTNGTRVNGEPIQVRILRYGDLITIGRSVLLFGSRDEIAARLARLRSQSGDVANRLQKMYGDSVVQPSALDFELSNWDDEDLQATLHTLEPPELPSRLSPMQAAQLSELLEYLHVRIRHLLASVRGGDDERRVTLDQEHWQGLVDLQARLARYLHDAGHPDDEGTAGIG